MLILNVIAAISLILACLCCFISPETIWWIGFCGLAYMYLLIVNICFVVIWVLIRKRTFVLISTITILFASTFLGKNIQLFEKEISEEDRERSYKVLSFNVDGFSSRKRVQTDGNTQNIFEFLRDENADIICIQEYTFDRWDENFDENTIRKFLDKTPYYYAEMQRGHFGVATFSKYPIIRKELVYINKTNNICMCSDVLMGTDTIRVYNVHLISTGFRKAETGLLENVVRIEYDRSDVRTIKSIIRKFKISSYDRAEQVEILISHIAKSPYPVIICGDFNDTPMSYSYHKVRGNRKDAFIEAGSGRSTTFNIGRIASLRIDYILYSDVFKAYSYDSPRVDLSDHFPVMCRLVKK